MKLGSLVGLLILLVALGYVALHIQKNGVALPEADNVATGPQVSNGAQAAADDLYKKQNEFRTEVANRPEKPSVGYVKLSPAEQR